MADTSKSIPRIVGDYEVVQKIAEGGMGMVYKGRHRQTGETVAIKMVSPDLTHNNALLLKRFEQEFRAASRLNHPNVVRGLDYGTAGETTYLVMEFVDGESLGEKLERNGKLPEAEAVRIISLAAKGLEDAHQHGLIHRDVKPDNIMLTGDGQVKLADLGLVKAMDADINLTKTGRGLGTPHFMAPEQFRNAKNADARCDIYSLGATLYQMVTGELPFRALGPLDTWMRKVNNELAPPRKLVPGLSERVEVAIRRAMDADPERRPASCREFVEDLTDRGSRKTQALDNLAPAQDVWYLVYRDEEGKQSTVKGTKAGICRALKEGRLGDASNIRVCRTKAGPFEPVRSHSDFREAAGASPATSSPSSVATTPFEVPAVGESAAAPARRPTSTAPRRMPHIPLEVQSARTREWVKWILVALVAMAAGLLIGLYARRF